MALRTRISPSPRPRAEAVDPDEEDLINEFHKNPAAFASLYRKYLVPVYRYLYTRVEQPADAEDLTSQVFLAALEGLGSYQHQGCFAAWLFSIARRKAADCYRIPHTQVLLDPDSDLASSIPDPLVEVIQDEELRRLVSLIGQLREDERELLRLRFAARLNFAEIALVLKRKPSAVKMSLYRLLARLESQLEAENE